MSDVFVYLTLFLSLCVLGEYRDADKIHGISVTHICNRVWLLSINYFFPVKTGAGNIRRRFHNTSIVYIFSFTISKESR